MAIAGKVAITPGYEWSVDVAYDKLVVVTFENNVYLSTKPSTGIEPTNEECWMLLIENVTAEDLAELQTTVDNILNGTTPVGDSKKLNGLTAKEVGASGARNLLPYPYVNTTVTKLGATMTDNGDGTFTLNGTPTSVFTFDGKPFVLESGVYTLSGSPAMGDSVNGGISLRNATTGTGIGRYDSGDGYTLTLTEQTEVFIRLVIQPAYGEATNLTFRPMLEIGSVAHDFVPYHLGGAKDADTVDGWHIYSSLAELGLDEATATVESIVNAMANNAILFHKLSGTATSATLQFPYNYSMFKVEKLNTSYVAFECIGTGNFPIYYGYYNGGSANKWSGWSTQFLPLTGGKLTGSHILLNNGTGRLLNYDNATQLEAFDEAENTNNRRLLVIRNSNLQSDVKKALAFCDAVDGVMTQYNVLHSGNSNAVIKDTTAPSDTTAVWIDTTNKKVKVYKDGAWTALA